MAIPPNDLRDALAKTCSASFAMGKLGDPIEGIFLIFTKYEFERKLFVLAYQAVLHRIHAHLVAKEDDVDGCEALHCVVHRKFAMNIIEQNRCDRCEATGFCQNIFNVSTVLVSNYHLY